MRRALAYNPRMDKSFMFGVMVIILLALFSALALPEIVGVLSTTQSTASGITPALDIALTQFPYVLSIVTVVIIGMVLVIGLRR